MRFVCLLITLALSCAVLAQEFPRRPVRFVVPLPPGGSPDLTARTIASGLAGTWPHQKIVLLTFPDRGAFESWSDSPEYTEIAKDRIAATTGSVLLVSGIA